MSGDENDPTVAQRLVDHAMDKVGVPEVIRDAAGEMLDGLLGRGATAPSRRDADDAFDALADARGASASREDPDAMFDGLDAGRRSSGDLGDDGADGSSGRG